jgi:hypothetical protein
MFHITTRNAGGGDELPLSSAERRSHEKNEEGEDREDEAPPVAPRHWRAGFPLPALRSA